MATLTAFPSRIRFVNADGTLSTEAYRFLIEVFERVGGSLGSSGGDTFVSNNDFGSIEAQQSAGGDISADVLASIAAQSMSEMLQQPATMDNVTEMLMQPPSDALFLDLPQYTTANAPAYKKGRMYFDLTLNKARVGGATAYETITSA